MGFVEWLERKKDLARARNDAQAEALKAYYQSDEYKKDIAEQQKQKMKEGKGDLGSWLKNVSNKAANNLKTETSGMSRINEKLLQDHQYWKKEAKKEER